MSRARLVLVLDWLLGATLVVLVGTLVVWRSQLPLGALTQLRPEDVLLGGLALLTLRCWLSPFRLPAVAPARAVGLGVALYAVVFSFLTVGRHRTFQTHALDLGQYAQNLWDLAGGREPYDTVFGWHAWGNHFSPVFYLLAPGAALFSGPVWLLVFQSVALALGAVPLFLLARRRLTGPSAAAVALLYLANPTLHGVNIRDFHPAALAIPFLLTAIYAWEAQRPALFALATFLTLTTREDAAIAVVGLALWLALAHRRWGLGAGLAVAGVAWLLIAVHWLMPFFRDDGAYPYIVGHYRHLGTTLGEVLLAPLTRPGTIVRTLLQWTRARYLLALLAPLAFLPLLAPTAAVGALAALAQNTLSDYPSLFHHRSQHQSFILPFLFAGAVAALAKLERGWRPAAWITPGRALATGAILSLVLTARTVNDLAINSWQPGEKHRAAHRLMARIEPGARVSATERFFPHLYERARVFVLPDAATTSDYVLADGALLARGWLGKVPAVRTGDRIDLSLPELAGRQARFRILAEDHGVLLLRRLAD